MLLQTYLVLPLLSLPLVFAQEERQCGRSFPECPYGFECLERKPGDTRAGRFSTCQRPTCGGPQNITCPATYAQCRVFRNDSSGSCFAPYCGNGLRQCEDGRVCMTDWFDGSGKCQPKLPSHPLSSLPATLEGESCRGPQDCYYDQVCVDFIKGGMAYGVPGICINRVDCRAQGFPNCPIGYQCNLKNREEPFCEPDFTPIPNMTVADLPQTPSGETCFLFRRGGPPLPCPRGKMCVDPRPNSMAGDGPGVCVPQIYCGEKLGPLGSSCPTERGWHCTNQTGIGFCGYQFPRGS